MTLAIDASTPAAPAFVNTGAAITSPAFSPPAGSVLFAFPGAIVIGTTLVHPTISNTGAALTWNRITFSEQNSAAINQSAEVYYANNPTAQSGITVTATWPGTEQTLGMPVLVCTGAAATQNGATNTQASANSSGTAESCLVTTTAPGSLVIASTVYWDHGIAPSGMGAGQTTTFNGHSFVTLDTTSDAGMWVQGTSATQPSGTAVTISATAPTGGLDVAAFEVLAAPAPAAASLFIPQRMPLGA